MSDISRARPDRLSGYDAVLVTSFGGPELREDVIPFLENVLRGKNVPAARMAEVAEHYYHFEGRSPIGPATRALVEDLRGELDRNGPRLPVYLGNRNWHPLLEATLRQMAADGVLRALALVTSAFGSYSGCRQYLEDIERARRAVGASAPEIDKIRLYFNHPGLIAIWGERLRAARAQAPAAELVFTAHSIPTAMAKAGPYEAQLTEACRLAAEAAGAGAWRLAYQSRSGPPQQAWLEPALEAELGALARRGAKTVIVAPIGFLSDHMEVVYDLEYEARQVAAELGMSMVRVKTPGDHVAFAALLGQLIRERTEGGPRLRVGDLPPWPDVCPPECCLAGAVSARPGI